MKFTILILMILSIASTAIYPKVRPLCEYIDSSTYIECENSDTGRYVVTSANVKEFETWRRQKEYLEGVVNNGPLFTLSVGYGTQVGAYGQINIPINFHL